MQGGSTQRSLLWPVAAAILLFLAAVALIGNISGEFPINDDWAYSLPVEWAHRWGVVRFTNWQYMTLIGQTLIGWGWVSLFGFSYLALRILTLLIAAGGLLALFLLARLVTGRERVAALLVLGWAVNPIFLASATTFMTDIYFWAATTGAVLLLFVGLDGGRKGWLACGWALALVAMSIRQMAIAIPIGFLVADLCRNGWSWRVVLRGIAPLAGLLLFLAAFTRIVDHTIGLPTQYPLPARQLAEVLQDMLHLHPRAFLPMVRGLATGALYLGVFALPLALAVAPTMLRRIAPWPIAIAAFAVVLVSASPLPLPGNTLQTWGLGPRGLPDLATPTHAGWLAYLLSALGCWSIAILFCAAVTAVRTDLTAGLAGFCRKRWAVLGLVTVALVSYAPLILVYGPWFDRHMLTTAPLLLVALVALILPASSEGNVGLLSWIVVALTGITGIALVHDAFAWHRARAALIERETNARHVPTLAIDGGFEHNNLLRHPTRPGRAAMPAPLLAPPAYARCAVSAAPLPGMMVDDTIAIDRWLPLGNASFVIGCRSGG